MIEMDGDPQSDPADIPRLLGALRGHDCVATRRRRREDDPVKRISSRIGNRVGRGIADCFAIRWYRRRVVPARRTAEGRAP